MFGCGPAVYSRAINNPRLLQNKRPYDLPTCLVVAQDITSGLSTLGLESIIHPCFQRPPQQEAGRESIQSISRSINRPRDMKYA